MVNQSAGAAAIAGAAVLFTGLIVISTSVRGSEGGDGNGHVVQSLPNMLPFPNASGLLATYNAGGGSIDLTGPFFQSLGTNGRSCGSCHRPAEGWSISADEIKHRFNATQGLDPIFRTNDGSNCDHNIDTSTVGGRRKAYSLLIEKGLIRVALPVPSNAEFNVIGVVNPYGCGDPSTLSMYRRPLPSTNLRFLSTLMWDGRESSIQTGTEPINYAAYPGNLNADLAHQSVDATNGHAQGAAGLSAQQQSAIVAFEMALSTAQMVDYRAGELYDNGAAGGPEAINLTIGPAFFIGINDPLGQNPQGTQFTPTIFNLYDSWVNAQPHGSGLQQARRASILRGQNLFNSKPINITGVAGLNDDLNLASIPGTCGTCHDSPNVGNHSVSAPLNIGVGDVTSPLGVNYLPVFTLQNKTNFEIKTTTDPGRAMITGRWKDVGRLKGPILRGLAGRAPYFHNGSADSLRDVLEFYNQRFQVGFTEQEKNDLVAFLSTL
jgi:cytochrome c peroxidase